MVNVMRKMDVFNTISFLCTQKSISITALCKEVTGSSGNLPTWRKGNLSAKTLCALADYLGVTTDQLLGRAPILQEPVKVKPHKMIKARRR